MHPDTNLSTPIDPRLTGATSRLAAQPLTVLPTRTHDDGEAEDDDESGQRNAGSEKRQKLNLWKCKQCREARKKVPCIDESLSFVAFLQCRRFASYQVDHALPVCGLCKCKD
jgi:hypothetical protein